MGTANASPGRQRWTDGLTGYHYLVLAVASLGWFFDTMDQWIYVQARQPALQALLGASASYEQVAQYSGYVQSIFILGWATGGFLFGIVGDRLGRTTTMAITVGMYAVFTGLSGLAPNWEFFALFRFLTGLGIGGEFAAGAALVAEVFPNHARPTALGIMQAFSAIGNVMAGAINFAVPQLLPEQYADNAWRVMFFVGFAPAVLVFLIRILVREPDKWHEARKEASRSGIQLGSIWELFSNRTLCHHTLVGVGLAAVGVIGFWGIGTFSPDLLRRAINPDNLPELKSIVEQRVGLAIMAQNAGAFFGILVWTWLAQVMGRRPAFAMSFLACTIVVPVTFHFTTSTATAFLLYPLMGFTTTSLFGGYAVYFPELFPTRLRATGTGFCYNVARYVAIAGPSLFGSLRSSVGIQWAATIVSVVFLLGLAVLPFAPETKDRPLPD